MRFVIYAPSFDINSGGAIVLHRLCDRLRAQGHEALIHPYIHLRVRRPRLSLNPARTIVRLSRYLARYYASLSPWRYFRTFDRFDTPIAKPQDVRAAIIVYSERVAGNPLKARKVVRWLLHRPGYFTGVVDYGREELFFYWQRFFIDEKLNVDPDNCLIAPYLLTDIYRQTNFGKREGTCYILRKGKARAIKEDLRDATIIDDLPHEKVAGIFNQCEYCVSYDTKTLYSKYAVLCGCKSVVVPEEGVSRQEWQPDEELGYRGYGIAYGFEDLEYAAQTRHKLLQAIQDTERQAEKSVRRFTDKCRQYFAEFSR